MKRIENSYLTPGISKIKSPTFCPKKGVQKSTIYKIRIK
jgi:hypothetical protein